MRSKGERLRAGLREALGGNPHVKEVRGLGLLCGIQLDVVRRCSSSHFLSRVRGRRSKGSSRLALVLCHHQ